MKKLFLILLSVLLMLAVTPVMAAQLIEENQSGLPQQVSIYSITCRQQDVTWSLTDGDMESNLSLRNQTASPLVLTMELLYDDISAIWIRNGDYSSLYAYNRCYAARDVAVDITYNDGQKASHLYRLNATYQKDQTWGDWYQGYQRLALPGTYEHVTQITLTVRNYYSFSNTPSDAPVVITDIAVTGPSNPYEPDGDINGGYEANTEDDDFRRVTVTLTMRMATRTGPCTKYTEPGSFFHEGYEVDVITQAYDDYNEIWWVQIEFRYNGELMRAYTGVKRIDADLDYVPVERYLDRVWVKQTVTPWYGPGYDYRQYRYDVPSGTYGTVYNRENGWVQVDYYDNHRGQYRRVWVPDNMTESY